MKRNAVAWAALVLSVAALVGSRNFTQPVTATQDVPEEGQQVAKALSNAFGAVAEYVGPSVVQINVEKKSSGPRLQMRPGPGGQEMTPKDLEEMLKRFFGPNFQPNGPSNPFQDQQFAAEGTGSGFVFDDKGHILTNNHVVEDADTIKVTFWDGVEAEAKVVGTSPETDVAVIKVENTSYRAVKIGSSQGLKVGEWVLALGSPFGLDHTVTAGIVSATNRNDVGINRFESFIQTDAAINPGNSGGPLVDMSGRVVGINSAIATASRSNAGVGFAIPIDMATRLANKLIKNGKLTPVMMGVAIEPLTPALARQLGLDPKTQGVLITEVGDGTPAAKAGLKVGDVITGFDGEKITSRTGLQYLVTTSDVGQSYPLTYLRNGEKRETTVSPTNAEKILAGMDRGGSPTPSIVKPKPSAPEVNDFGLAVAPVTAELAEKYDWDADDEGLVVTAVKEGSPAEASGIQEGDRITKIIKDQQITPIKSLSDFQGVAEKADEVAIYVEDVNKKLPGQFMTLTKPKK